MKLLILLVLLCCLVFIQSKPVHKNWKQVVDKWRGRDMHRHRKALDETSKKSSDDDDDDDDDDEGADEGEHDEDECYFTDKCNYYNDNYDPCDLAPYDVGCEDDDYPDDDDYDDDADNP